MHNLYFGHVTANENAQDLGDLFEHNGMQFLYMIEYNEDGIQIIDTANRCMPVDKEDMEDLLRALTIAVGIKSAEDEADALYDTRIAQLHIINNMANLLA
jgi:hypothetical protein